MSRTLVALLLLHHIEGQCKPWSSATLAARAALAKLTDHIIHRDGQAAVQRAQERQAAAVERARRMAAARAARRSDAAVSRPDRRVARGHVPHELDAPRVVPGYIERLHEYQERDR